MQRLAAAINNRNLAANRRLLVVIVTRCLFASALCLFASALMLPAEASVRFLFASDRLIGHPDDRRMGGYQRCGRDSDWMDVIGPSPVTQAKVYWPTERSDILRSPLDFIPFSLKRNDI